MVASNNGHTRVYVITCVSSLTSCDYYAPDTSFVLIAVKFPLVYVFFCGVPRQFIVCQLVFVSECSFLAIEQC